MIYSSLSKKNILFDNQGYPRFIGLRDSFDQTEKHTTQFLDTLKNDLITYYLAPEILMRELPQGESDFYSLGIIIYEMMTGRVHLIF